MDRIESLKFFIKVVEKKGIAAAGRDFGMSSATASERLGAVEAMYGTKLINRTTRSIALTSEGEELLKGARLLIEEAEALENKVRRGTERISGPIKISVPQDIGRKLIAPLIDKFVETHPDVQVELYLDDKYLDLISNGIDLAVRLGRLKKSSMKVRKLADNRRLVCASPQYLSKYGTPHHPDDITHHNCLIMQMGHVVDNEWEFQIHGRKKVYLVTGNRTSNNGTQVKDWCLKGYGIALKSFWGVRDYIESGELVELLAEYHNAKESSLQILYPGGRAPSRRVTALVDHLMTCFKEPPLSDDAERIANIVSPPSAEK